MASPREKRVFSHIASQFYAQLPQWLSVPIIPLYHYYGLYEMLGQRGFHKLLASNESIPALCRSLIDGFERSQFLCCSFFLPVLLHQVVTVVENFQRKEGLVTHTRKSQGLRKRLDKGPRYKEAKSKPSVPPYSAVEISEIFKKLCFPLLEVSWSEKLTAGFTEGGYTVIIVDYGSGESECPKSTPKFTKFLTSVASRMKIVTISEKDVFPESRPRSALYKIPAIPIVDPKSIRSTSLKFTPEISERIFRTFNFCLVHNRVGKAELSDANKIIRKLGAGYDCNQVSVLTNFVISELGNFANSPESLTWLYDFLKKEALNCCIKRTSAIDGGYLETMAQHMPSPPPDFVLDSVSFETLRKQAGNIFRDFGVYSIFRFPIGSFLASSELVAEMINPTSEVPNFFSRLVSENAQQLIRAGVFEWLFLQLSDLDLQTPEANHRKVLFQNLRLGEAPADHGLLVAGNILAFFPEAEDFVDPKEIPQILKVAVQNGNFRIFLNTPWEVQCRKKVLSETIRLGEVTSSNFRNMLLPFLDGDLNDPLFFRDFIRLVISVQSPFPIWVGIPNLKSLLLDNFRESWAADSAISELLSETITESTIGLILVVGYLAEFPEFIPGLETFLPLIPITEEHVIFMICLKFFERPEFRTSEFRGVALRQFRENQSLKLPRRTLKRLIEMEDGGGDFAEFFCRMLPTNPELFPIVARCADNQDKNLFQALVSMANSRDGVYYKLLLQLLLKYNLRKFSLPFGVKFSRSVLLRDNEFDEEICEMEGKILASIFSDFGEKDEYYSAKAETIVIRHGGQGTRRLKEESVFKWNVEDENIPDLDENNILRLVWDFQIWPKIFGNISGGLCNIVSSFEVAACLIRLEQQIWDIPFAENLSEFHNDFITQALYSSRKKRAFPKLISGLSSESVSGCCNFTWDSQYSAEKMEVCERCNRFSEFKISALQKLRTVDFSSKIGPLMPADIFLAIFQFLDSISLTRVSRVSVFWFRTSAPLLIQKWSLTSEFSQHMMLRLFSSSPQTFQFKLGNPIFSEALKNSEIFRKTVGLISDWSSPVKPETLVKYLHSYCASPEFKISEPSALYNAAVTALSGYFPSKPEAGRILISLGIPEMLDSAISSIFTRGAAHAKFLVPLIQKNYPGNDDRIWKSLTSPSKLIPLTSAQKIEIGLKCSLATFDDPEFISEIRNFLLDPESSSCDWETFKILAENFPAESENKLRHVVEGCFNGKQLGEWVEPYQFLKTRYPESRELIFLRLISGALKRNSPIFINFILEEEMLSSSSPEFISVVAEYIAVFWPTISPWIRTEFLSFGYPEILAASLPHYEKSVDWGISEIEYTQAVRKYYFGAPLEKFTEIVPILMKTFPNLQDFFGGDQREVFETFKPLLFLPETLKSVFLLLWGMPLKSVDLVAGVLSEIISEKKLGWEIAKELAFLHQINLS